VDEQLELLLAERAIARVLATHCRGADRFDLEMPDPRRSKRSTQRSPATEKDGHG
jgi:hypothetical protein